MCLCVRAHMRARMHVHTLMHVVEAEDIFENQFSSVVVGSGDRTLVLRLAS